MPTANTPPTKLRASAAKPRSGAAKRAASATATKRAASAKTTAKTGATRHSSAGKQTNTAERAVLIPVGAALIARERFVSEVGDAIASYNSSAKASAQLRRFERRGATARNRVERELRKTRVRVEREVRQTRTRVEREVTRRRRNGEELATRVQERLLDLV